MGARRLALLLALALGGAGPVEAAEPKKAPTVKVGIPELTPSAPVFVAEALETLPR